jgi:hypothetical protein
MNTGDVNEDLVKKKDELVATSRASYPPITRSKTAVLNTSQREHLRRSKDLS